MYRPYPGHLIFPERLLGKLITAPQLTHCAVNLSLRSLDDVQTVVNGSFGEGPQHPLHSLGRQGFFGAETSFFRRFFSLIFPSARFALVAFALNPIRTHPE